MATIRKEVELPVSVESVWAKLADLEGVASMISFLEDAQVDGDRRVCAMSDGGKLEELIVSVDPSLHRVAYTITGSPFGFEFHAASMEVIATATGCRFVWTTDVKPDQIADALRPIFDAEMTNVATALST